MGAPAIWRVLLNVRDPLSVAPLHCTTVPFSLTVVVIVRVEVMSATGPHAVGSTCEGGHKGDVTALWRCDTIAVHAPPNWCAI